MTLLSVSNVGVSFGATELFKNITFTVGEGERWGIIGRNGAGKSTIFSLITGERAPTVGSVARKPGLRHALLDQHRAFEGATTVWEAGAAAWREVIALEKHIAAQAVELGELGENVSDAFLERFGRDQERFADMGGYEYHARVDAVLQGLGFDAEESKTVSCPHSGGERGRVGLRRNSSRRPICCCSTNDQPSRSRPTTAAGMAQRGGRNGHRRITRRAFLDATARTSCTWKPNRASGKGTSQFVPQRAERRLSRERELEKQRAYVKKEEEYIRRNIAGVNVQARASASDSSVCPAGAPDRRSAQRRSRWRSVVAIR